MADALTECIDLAKKNPAKARLNPENYVFFITHMYHLFGEDEGEDPISIPTNWDFRVATISGVQGLRAFRSGN